MEIMNLKSWCDFEQELLKLNKCLRDMRTKNNLYVSPILFRGQENACWELHTTLERYTKQDQFNALDYFNIAQRVRPQIETFTGRQWRVELDDFEKWGKNTDFLPGLNSFPAQEYMIYLRHHGFPSPLLDWTESPYVASYFAFNKVDGKTERVSIYAYIEWTSKGKTQAGNDPVITSLPENVPSHRRHYVQQSRYTICAKRDNDGVIYTSHESAFAKTEEGEQLLYKFTLPISERIKVLKTLDLMNINSLALFDTEDSLMETVALRNFYLNKENL